MASRLLLIVRSDSHPNLARLLIVTSFISLTVAGCTRHINVTKEMAWECAPEYYMPEYPDAQTVRFKYVEDPSYEEVVSGRGLCDQLKGSGKKVIAVEYETWGNSSRGLIGFSEVSVDGKALVDAGGRGSSSARGRIGSHPLEKLYKSNSR